MAETKIIQEDAIRSRLLTTLGIQKPQAAATPSESRSDNSNINPPTLFRLHGRESAFRQSLNDSTEERRRHSRRPSRKPIVKFDCDVLVQPIASHKSFSQRIKNTLWTSTDELKDNAYRNQVEFEAEGWDYRKALEEEDMYIDAETGELVHPFWIEQQGRKEELRT
ncbi:hypothetical protein IV203_008019 [Nitzschia inconspicua]|uniref:Uncharacterized protein n=1 Tax=Nitzschia inconspicua TaxID=303405 RepID=A0A9K3PMA7_9STRA|nr:hypothetical protein IV203_008019 [Nitzschia inconspicua]